jgi:hypothetical protein
MIMPIPSTMGLLCASDGCQKGETTPQIASKTAADPKVQVNLQ